MDIFSNRLKFYVRNPNLYKWEKMGFNLEFYQKLSSDFFSEFKVKTIIDIGANEGQSTITFHLAFPEATIYAFEPLPESFNKLETNFTNFNNVHVINAALGDKIGDIIFEQNEYSASSSALKMTDKHINDFPFTTNSKSIKVNVETLDNIFSYKYDIENVLMKIDVQGYEKYVIMGGQETLSRVKILIVETSFDTLYSGQALFDEIYKMLSDLSFSYAGSFDQLISPKNGKVLQQDAIFVRRT